MSNPAVSRSEIVIGLASTELEMGIFLGTGKLNSKDCSPGARMI
jgi:hypothetical protein